MGVKFSTLELRRLPADFVQTKAFVSIASANYACKFRADRLEDHVTPR
jgi:hypothetical protein